ncbi:putative holin [Escherichia coli]|nr:putative holin [Escherichia coli]
MAAEPLSGGGAVGLTIGGASIFGILTNTDFGVVIGAFAGALFVVTQQKEVPVWRMCIHLLVAFVVGVLGAGVAASFMQWLCEVTDKPAVDHIIEIYDPVLRQLQRYEVITASVDPSASVYSIQLRRA